MANGPDENRRQIAYSSTIRMALQQETTRIWQYCTPHNVTAVMGLSFTDMKPFGPPAQLPAGSQAYEPISIKELSFSNRWLSSSFWDDWAHFHTYDQSMVLEDPNDPVIRYFRASFNRKKDEVAVAAMFGPTKRGKTLPGDDPDVTFPASQQVAVNVVSPGVTPANTGLNRAKLNKAFAMFVKNEAMFEDGPNGSLHMAVSARQLEDLLNDEKVTDRQFLLGQFQQTGRLSYLRFDFHDYQNLPVDASGYRRCPVWMTDGMRVGITQDLHTSFSRMDGYRAQPYFAYAKAFVGAARADEKLVVEVKCSEA